MGGEHPDDVSGTANQWRGLTGPNAGLKVDLSILRIDHEITGGDVRRDHPPRIAKGDAAGTPGVRAHPLPKDGRLRIESPEGEQPEFSSRPPLGKQHLHTGVIGAHQRHGSIDDLLSRHPPVASCRQEGIVCGQLTLLSVELFCG